MIKTGSFHGRIMVLNQETMGTWEKKKYQNEYINKELEYRLFQSKTNEQWLKPPLDSLRTSTSGSSSGWNPNLLLMSSLFPPSNSPSSPVPPHQLLLGFFMAESEDPHRINAPQFSTQPGVPISTVMHGLPEMYWKYLKVQIGGIFGMDVTRSEGWPTEAHWGPDWYG